MLLLVLILVLIAFGLLVVSLLSGSVLSAWVSVGVSVAAAAVLLVDWLQRRSAVRAGAEAAEAAPLPAAAPVPPPPVEPATEVIPAIRPDTGRAEAPEQVVTAVDGRDDERHDTRETVVMQAFAPSGSAEQPSGALSGIGPAEPNSSQSVTVAGGGRTAIDPADGPGKGRDGEGPDVVPTRDDADAEDTVKVASTAGRDTAGRTDAQDEPAVGALRGGPEPASASGAGSSTPSGTAAIGSSAGGSSAIGSSAIGSSAGGSTAGGASNAGASNAHGPGVGGRQDLPPLGPDGAPPEEVHDAAAAELVAGLGDEVLVVDELPRYHVGGCGSLVGRSVIPLPAREAVELGFTPCAWCTPDRRLSSRHRTSVR